MMTYGLLGGRLGHSWSKPIHNMLGNPDYELFPVTPDELKAIMTTRAFKGLNVTIPYKKDVMPYCDSLSDEAREVGSVNTLVMGADGRLVGHNTDLFGFLSMANRAGIALKGRKAAILGSGGTSLTAQAACRREGASFVVVSRGGPVDYDTLVRSHGDAQIIINATPVGMYPNNGASPVDLSAFPRCEGVLDVIYNPLQTRLLLDAQNRGIPCADGLWMLAAQAVRAHELFFGKPVDNDEIRRIHSALRAQTANLVLIGMPGCGKSTLGRPVAAKLDRPFVDLDAEIEKDAGMSIPDIFRTEGESGFRRHETEAAKRFGREKGQVIAAGGGIVKTPEAMDALRQNGVLIHVTRSLEALPTVGRPLSKDRDTLLRLEKERTPLYKKYADASVENDSTPEAAAQTITEAFYEAVDR